MTQIAQIKKNTKRINTDLSKNKYKTWKLSVPSALSVSKKSLDFK